MAKRAGTISAPLSILISLLLLCTLFLLSSTATHQQIQEESEPSRTAPGRQSGRRYTFKPGSRTTPGPKPTYEESKRPRVQAQGTPLKIYEHQSRSEDSIRSQESTVTTNFSQIQAQRSQQQIALASAEKFSELVSKWGSDDIVYQNWSASEGAPEVVAQENPASAIKDSGNESKISYQTSVKPINRTVHPLLVYSMRYEIRCFDLYNSFNRGSSFQQSNGESNSPITQQQLHFHNQAIQSSSTKQSKTLMGGLKNTIGLDFYYSDRESYIFWTDVIDERIYRGTILEGTITNVNVLVQSGLATAEGLAIDWIGHNIYWVESTLDHIEVANLNGTHRKTLIAGDMESPRAIAVDPRHGYLFWTDWDKKSPRIERATMSGEDRVTLVYIKEVNGGWPNGLTLDYDLLKIYWIDANSDSIHAVDYKGNNPQSILSNIKSLGHPFSITLFENNLYWTDWKTNSVSTANKYDGSEARELQKLSNRLFDIKVFHPSRQPKIDDNLNPCFKNNGNCSHLCLLSTNHSRRCDCPNLMKLSQDGLTCQSDENVLLIGRPNEIRGVDIEEPLHHIMAPISVPKVFSPRQFAFDAKSRTIFWVDSQTNEVKKVQIAGNNIETIIDVIIDTPSGLALDWISGTIYITSVLQHNSSGKIFISNLNGEYISILMDSSHGLGSPKSLAVHPVLGLLFCIEENENSEPIISVAGMDGKNRRIISSKLNDSKLENPSNLAMDFDLNRVYWINQARNPSEASSIQYYDIMEDKIVTVLDENSIKPDQRINPGVLCVDGDHLIMTGKNPTEMIVRFPKNNLNEASIRNTPNLDQILALGVFNATSQTGTNACSLSNGGCSQLCVPTNSTHRACKCTMGYTINPHQGTECIGKDLFLIFSYNLGMRGVSIDPGQSIDEHYLPPIHKAFRASSIDYVYRDNLIYWVDNEESSITRINRDTTNYRVVVQGLESEESIAIDWVAGNIYWLNPYYDIIELAHLNGSSRYVILSGDMDKANCIAVNPIKGYIVWSDIGQVPKIETANLDGSNRRVIVNGNLSHVDDLAIDYLDDYIYWVDSTLAIIERIKSDGSKRQVVYTGDSNQSYHNHFVSIAIFKEYLFIADSVHNGGSIIRCDKNTASDKKLLQQALGDTIRDITVYAEQPIPSVKENPCVKNNGDCQDICIFSGRQGRKRCVCSHGRLKQDGLTCEPYDTFLLYSKLSQIESLHIKEADESYKNSPYAPIAIENRSNIISLAIDYNSNRVIYSEITRDQICSIFFNGTDRRVLVEHQSLVEGIVYTNGQLYWTSIQDNSISRMNTTSFGPVKGTCDELGTCRQVEKIVALSPEDKPRGIAVDSCTNYVYWTNWNANASIQRASPQNDYRIESIITTNIKVPNGIAIDQKERRLYWCDARLDKIETADLDGRNRMVLVSAAPQHPFALAVWGEYVFWTDWLARGVFKADKYTGNQPSQIKKVMQRPMGIAVAAPEVLECPIDKCLIDNGGCATNEHCRSHAPVYDVECLPRNQVVDLRHTVTSLNPTSINAPINIRTYHDIIRNPLDRYNITEPVLIQPMLAGSKWHSTVIEAPSNDSSLKASQNHEITATESTSKQVTGQQVHQSPKASDEIPSTSTMSSKKDKIPTIVTPPPKMDNATTSYSAPTSSASQNSSMENTDKASTIAPSSNDNPAITEVPASSTTSSTVSTSTATDELNINITTSTQQAQTTPNSTSTTLPPCQVIPAALQPTTDMSSNMCDGQFRCYLSDKTICLPKERKCDGSHDCPSGEDENGCLFSKQGYNLKRETDWHKFVTVILVILAAAVAALFLVFGTKGRRRWFVCNNGGFGHRRMFDDNGTNIEISNPMFDEDDGNLVHCAFSIDLNERTTNFSNPLYERQVLLMNDKHVTTS